MKFIKILAHDLKLIFEWFIISMPDTIIFNYLRKKYFKFAFNIGSIDEISSGTKFVCVKKIKIMNNFLAGSNVEINACDSHGIFIGNNVGLSPRIYMRAANHNYDKLDVAMHHQKHNFKSIEHENNVYSIVIEDDVWIGAGAIILSGAKIGKGSVVSAGSVISSEVSPFSVVAGNPGRVILNRKKN